MSARERWFERTFPTDCPLGRHPSVRARLAGAPLRARAELEAFVPARRVERVGEHWSPNEHVGHLGDLEALWLARLDDLLAGAQQLTAADLENRATWQAGHNEVAGEDLLRRFTRLRGAFVARLDELDSSDFGRVARHPRLEQPMRLIDLLVFVAEHDDHHLGLLREHRIRTAAEMSDES